MKKWIFRLLVLITVVIGLGLFGLKIVSGTSDQHKNGLEQAFSQIFQGNAQFGKLKSFNLFPRFLIEIERLDITNVAGSGTINIGNAQIGFGPIDLLLKNRKIENFQLKDLSISEDLYTPLSIKLSDAGIYSDKEKNIGKFRFSGSYGDQAIAGQIDMGMENGSPSKFFFNADNNLMMVIGAVQVNGIFSPYVATGPEVSQIKLEGSGDKTKIGCEIDKTKTMPFRVFMKEVVAKMADVKATNDLQKLCDNLKHPS